MPSATPLLLVLAFLAPASAQFGFTDVSAAVGVPIPNLVGNNVGLGACFGDFNGDGLLDIIFVTGNAPVHHYQNQSSGIFVNRSLTTGLGYSTALATVLTAADIDNDGDMDLYMGFRFGPDRLYINDGTGNFTEQAGAFGVAGGFSDTMTASFGDYNRDGYLDLYVGKHQSLFTGAGDANHLYLNNRNGTFTETAAAAGVANMGLCFVSFWHDYNRDGWADLTVANDKGWSSSSRPNTTYRNNGDGTFTDVGIALGTNYAIGSMGGDFVDAFNDGGDDIYITNIGLSNLFHVYNPATQVYNEMAGSLQVQGGPADGWAATFLDYDNDGWQDVYVTHAGLANFMYRNPGALGVPWSNVGASLGVNTLGSKYCHMVGDFDNDGRVDIFIPRFQSPGLLLKNNVTNLNHWIRIRTQGTQSNRDGIGARVYVTAGGITQQQMVRTGVGFLGGSDTRLHFGLGSSTFVSEIRVVWPSGCDQVIGITAADQDITVTEPSFTSSGAPNLGSAVQLDLFSVMEGGQPYLMALSFSNGPTPIAGGRTVPIAMDPLAMLTLAPGNSVLQSPAGQLTWATAMASSPVFIPAYPQLSGVSIHAAAILVPGGVPRTVFAPLKLVIL